MRIAVIQNKNLQSPWPYNIWVQQSLEQSAAAKHATIVSVQFLGDIPEKPITGSVLFMVSCPSTSKLRRWYWYRVQLPALLTKMKADKVIDMNGRVSKNIIQPQILLIDAVLDKVKNKTRTYISKASMVFTYSEYARKMLEEQCPGNADKMQVWLPLLNLKATIPEWDIREQLKEKYAEGREYFLATGLTNLNELLNLLKAFSIFKKWQKSQMMLVIAGSDELFTDAFEDKLSTYRYRNDVGIIMPESIEQFNEVLSAAYALVHLPTTDADIEPLIIALHYGVPSIIPEGKTLASIAGNSALTVKDLLPENIGEKLQQLHKDEVMRSMLIDKAKQQFNHLQQAGSSNPLWIMKKRNSKK